MMANQGGYNNSYQADWDPSFSGYVPASNFSNFGGGYGGYGRTFGNFGGFGNMW